MNFQTINASASPEVQTNENFETIDYSSVYGKRHPVTTALTWGYYGGRWGGFSVAAGTLTLTNAATNYVVVLRSTGVISVSTASTNWDNTTDYARVYKLTTAGSVVTAVEDHRAGPGGVHGPSGVSASGPSSSTDNAIARWDSTTGKLLQNSVVTISDTGAIAGAISLSISQGTITDPANALTVASTWNDAADTFFGLDVGITVTNAAAASRLVRIRGGAAGATDLLELTTGGQLQLDVSGSSAGLLLGGDALLYRNSADVLRTPDSLIVDATLTVSGTHLIDSATSVTTPAGTGKLQVNGLSSVIASLGRFSADSTGPFMVFVKSRGTLVDTHGTVSNNDDIGTFSYYASDNAAYCRAGLFLCEVDAAPTPSSGIVQGRFVWFATNSGGTLTESFRCNSAGLQVASAISIGAAPSTTTGLLTAAGTTGVSSLRIPHGAAPSSPVNGDVWTTTAGLFVRINGATVGPLS